jgi:hypothetical protein
MRFGSLDTLSFCVPPERLIGSDLHCLPVCWVCGDWGVLAYLDGGTEESARLGGSCQTDGSCNK